MQCGFTKFRTWFQPRGDKLSSYVLEWEEEQRARMRFVLVTGS